MPSLNGWIKFYRQTLDNPVVMKSPNHLAVWMYILANATPSPYKVMFEGKETIIEAGQLITSRSVIANRLGIKNKYGKVDDNKVQRILRAFENAHQIAQQGTNKNRLITVNNWNKYQSTAQQDARRMHNKSTAKAQQAHTYREFKEDREDNSRENPTIYRDEIAEIVDYLNGKLGAHYRASTTATQKHITARLREGYTVADFKTVIDSKAAEWLGTDQAKFLRPETLFGLKFEGYLNTSAITAATDAGGIAQFLDGSDVPDDLADYDGGDPA